MEATGYDVFDVRRYGAVADGQTDSTAAIQAAIDACATAGGGLVLLSGGVFLSYTLRMKSNVRLEIAGGATLKCGPDPLKYPEFEPNEYWIPERCPRVHPNRRALIYAVGLTNISILGRGVIDGSAEVFHEPRPTGGTQWRRKSDTLIPGRMLMIVACRDVELAEFQMRSPSGWSMWILDCDRVAIHRIRIDADERFPNGDGIHLGGCRDVTVSDCIVNSMDDSLVLRSHQEAMRLLRPLERVVVSNCILRSQWCCAVRIGWSGDYEIRDCSLCNIVVPHSGGGGIRIELPEIKSPENSDPARNSALGTPPALWRRPFAVENIRFDNISLNAARHPIVINIAPGSEVRCIKDIYFSNMKIRGGMPLEILCRPCDHVSGIRFSNVEFEIRRTKGGVAAIPATWFGNATNITLDGVKFSDMPDEELEKTEEYRQSMSDWTYKNLWT